MRVALLCEGTYPYARGGVSVWCDQLIAGLPEYDFHVYAITGQRMSAALWTMPSNTTALVNVPLWEQRPPVRQHHDSALQAVIDGAYEQLLRALFAQNSDVQGFLGALRTLFEYAQDTDLTAALTTQRNTEMLYQVWQAHAKADVVQHRRGDLVLQPSLADALQASVWLEHFLRPLSCPPPQADVCHAVSNGLSPLLAFTSKWRYQTPFVLTEHGVYLRERYLELQKSPHTAPFKSFLLRFYGLLTRSAYQMADMITPGSQYNERWEVQQGADAGRIRPVYNGINPAIFPQATFEPTSPTISWVGRIDPLKDLETLIRAFGLVKDELPGARLRMFGSVPSGNEGYAQHCQSLIGQLGLGQHATFEGHIPSIVDAYHAGHMVALTSISEGFPYTLIEAMASGRATVATDVGGVSEALGDTGLVVPSRNYRAVARASLKLLQNDELRSHMGQAARARALSQFTLDSFLEIYRYIYPHTRLMCRPVEWQPAGWLQ